LGPKADDPSSGYTEVYNMWNFIYVSLLNLYGIVLGKLSFFFWCVGLTRKFFSPTPVPVVTLLELQGPAELEITSVSLPEAILNHQPFILAWKCCKQHD
jgi:hypothetical protein